MTFRPSGQRPLPAAYALPAGCTALLGVGALAAGTDGHVGPEAVLVLTAMIVAGTSFVAEARAAPLLAVVGWLTVTGFSRAPYAELNPGGPHALRNGLVIALVALAGAGAGVGWRGAWRAGRSPEASRSILMNLENQRLPSTLEIVDRLEAPLLPATPASAAQSSRRKVIRRTPAEPSRFGKATGVGRRRQVAGLTLAFVALPLLTAGLVQVREELPLVDDLLLYLATLVGITVVGGFWPAVTAAVAASLLLNWFFTPPIHTWTIEQPQNLLALLLFITVAVSVSSTVHAAAQRAREAARASAESAALLDLARTVLSGEDTPRAILGHLTAVLHLPAELEERTATGWIRVASSAESFRVGPAGPGTAAVL
ncbi:MAG TPA: DUF4118 domain-containing protein, partial [Gemmatimonadales bacterium]|nr:DUF4118 domain-containing protein [Gemmatimonadales bacterium]